MAAKTSWHKYEMKLYHCHPMYKHSPEIINFITCLTGKHKMPGRRAIDPVSSIFSRSLFKLPIFQFFSENSLLPNVYSRDFDAEILLQHDIL